MEEQVRYQSDFPKGCDPWGELTVRMPCQRPTSFLKSSTFTTVSATNRRRVKVQMLTWKCTAGVCVCFTLSVAAGLRHSLAVCEQSDSGHCDSQHAPIFTGFILRQTHGQMSDCVIVETTLLLRKLGAPRCKRCRCWHLWCEGTNPAEVWRDASTLLQTTAVWANLQQNEIRRKKVEPEKKKRKLGQITHGEM